MIKKREKVNNSALAQLGEGSHRKFATSGSQPPSAGTMFVASGKDGVIGSAQVAKVYNQKHPKSGSSGGNDGATGSGTGKSRRQHSTDKTVNWNTQALNATSGSNSSGIGARK